MNELLLRLEGVKGRNGSWIARCPGHDDRSPSLSVKELGDGRILMHCFGGCGTDAVLGAIGLTITDLFPEPLGTHLPPVRGFTAADALRCLAREATVLALANADALEGKQTDQERLLLASGRLNEALEFVHAD